MAVCVCLLSYVLLLATLWTKPVGLFCPWDFPGSTRVGCHFLLQGIFQTQGSNLSLLHWQADSLPQSHLESPLLLHLIFFLVMNRILVTKGWLFAYPQAVCFYLLPSHFTELSLPFVMLFQLRLMNFLVLQLCCVQIIFPSSFSLYMILISFFYGFVLWHFILSLSWIPPPCSFLIL